MKRLRSASPPPTTLEAALAKAQGAWSAGRLREAADAWAIAEFFRPGDPTLRFNRAVALRNLGDDAVAVELFREFLGGERRVEALVHLAELGAMAANEMADLAAAAKAGGPHAAPAAYALGRVHEREGRWDAAFDAWAAGAALKRAEFGDAVAAEDAAESDTVARAMKLFSADFVAHHAGAGSTLATPIFVIGLPRSGTTLVEQILASHPKVLGMGESAVLHGVLAGQYPYDALAPAGPDHFRRLADAYLRSMRARGWGNNARFVDKTPSSLWAVGAIHLMFPRAVILHTVRNLADTAVSNFSQLYETGNALSYDLGDIGRQYRRYRQIMDHWTAVLPPGRIVEVRLEDLVAGPEARIRWLVTEACGLAWDPACLKFYDNPRAVLTASASQVRRPIFSSSTGRWRRYERHLGPLFAALGDSSPA